MARTVSADVLNEDLVRHVGALSRSARGVPGASAGIARLFAYFIVSATATLAAEVGAHEVRTVKVDSYKAIWRRAVLHGVVGREGDDPVGVFLKLAIAVSSCLRLAFGDRISRVGAGPH